MLHLPTMFRISYQGPCITVRFQEYCLTRLLFTNTSEYFKNQASNCKVKHDKKNHPIMTKNQFNLLVLLEKNIFKATLYMPRININKQEATRKVADLAPLFPDSSSP